MRCFLAAAFCTGLSVSWCDYEGQLGYLRRDPLCLLFSLGLLFRGKDFPPFSVTGNVLAVGFVLESGLHVFGEAYLTNDWDETFSTKDRSKDLFRVDVPAVWGTLFGTKFIIFLAEGGIRESLVGDRDFLESVLGMWIIPVLIWVEFDSKPTWTNQRRR